MPGPNPLILVTSQMHLTGETGVQTHIRDLLGYCSESRRDAAFVGPELSVDRISFEYFALRIFRRSSLVAPQLGYDGMQRMFLSALRRELRRRLMHHSSWTVYAQDPLCAQAALSLRRRRDQRVVLAVHFNVSQAAEMADRGVLKRDGWLYRNIQRRECEVLAEVDGVVFFSEFMRRKIAERGIVPRDLIVIPHATETPKVLPEVSGRDLIAIGSLEPRKNQAYLLYVLSAAARLGHRYTLTLVGSGEDRQRLEVLAKDLGLQSQVQFMGRYSPASSLLSSHHLLVHAALIENFPITLVEALAAGKPILAPAVGGIPEVFRDGIEGFFWPLDNPEEGARILIRMMQDEELRWRMSKAAFERFKECFTRAAVYGRLLCFLDAQNQARQEPCEAGCRAQD